MGPTKSLPGMKEGQGPSDEHFKKLIDAETLEQTGPFPYQGPEVTMSLTVYDWHSDEPSIYLMLDETPSETDFEGWLNTRERTLEFQFTVPTDYPGRRWSFGSNIQRLLSNRDLLGIGSMYIGSEAVKDCLDELKRSRTRRPQWSEPVSLYGAQFSWMKRSPASPLVYFKVVVDPSETCIFNVNETNQQYKDDIAGDVDKFIKIMAIPLRVKLRVFWWRGALEQYNASQANLPTEIPGRQPGSSEDPEQQWWWPLVQARKDRAEKPKMKTTEENVPRSHAESAQAGLMTSEADISHSSPQQQNPPPSSSPQTTLPSKKKKKKKSKKKESRSSVPDSSSSATQLVSPIPSEDPDSQSVLAEAPSSDTFEEKLPPSTPTHQQPSSYGVTECFHENSLSPSDSLSKALEDTPKQSSLNPAMSQKGSPKGSPKDGLPDIFDHSNEAYPQAMSLIRTQIAIRASALGIPPVDPSIIVPTANAKAKKKKKRKRSKKKKKTKQTETPPSESSETKDVADEEEIPTVGKNEHLVGDPNLDLSDKNDKSKVENVAPDDAKEMSTVGKYDHLIGDPNLDLSNKKNKGRVESITQDESQGTTEQYQSINDDDEEPRFQAFIPEAQFKVGSSSRQHFDSETPTPSEAYVPPKIGVPSSTYFATSLAKIGPQGSKRESTTTRRGASVSEESNQSIQKGKEVTKSSQPSHSEKHSRKPLTTGPLSPIPEVSSPPAVRDASATSGSSTTAQTESTLKPLVTPGGAAGSSSTKVVTVRKSRAACRAGSHSHPEGVVQCAKANCNANCDLWDSASIFCPRCGPYAEIRYCSQEHLIADVKAHWAWCGQPPITHSYRDSIAELVRERVPLMPCLHGWDTPERHRQALFFDRERQSGDYFIFSDWEDLKKAGFPKNTLQVRCPTRIVATVKFDDPEQKDRFRRVLAVMLFSSVENTNLGYYMFRLIRDALRSGGAWTDELDTALKYQFDRELSMQIYPQVLGSRHACEIDWDGRNKRHCRDPICGSERYYLLGDMGRGRGYRRLVEDFETGYWILRAARTTHPHVTSVVARTRGEGFVDIVEEDRRVFRRGPGWDGAGSRDLEIEEVNC
ncbi:hypothetical protein PHISCL_02363 [Aspergillus sclerotialis]|uniref:Uncharacterized protein n=1 Tax=Aspergillus sclerotialis TaxID=2070753 RepID=A0A3A3A0T6_9EURO|nr:hypothetical protein PHISCL_02363 [Aspergillus sclerotialis]